MKALRQALPVLLAALAAAVPAADISSLLDTVDKLDAGDRQEFDALIRRADGCTKTRDFGCAEAALAKARKFASTAALRSDLQQSQQRLSSEREQLLAEQRAEREARERAEREAEERAERAERLARRQREAEEAAEERRNAERATQQAILGGLNAFQQSLRQSQLASQRTAELVAQANRERAAAAEREAQRQADARRAAAAEREQAQQRQQAQQLAQARQAEQRDTQRRLEEERQQREQAQRERERAEREAAAQREQERLRAEAERQRLAAEAAAQRERERAAREAEKQRLAAAEAQARRDYLAALASGTRLAARKCPDGEGKYYMVGILAKVSPKPVSCIDVHFKAVCPGNVVGSQGVGRNFLGASTDCFMGDTVAIEPKPACPVDQVQVQVTEVRACGE